jgi:hypothetical protein
MVKKNFRVFLHMQLTTLKIHMHVTVSLLVTKILQANIFQINNFVHNGLHTQASHKIVQRNHFVYNGVGRATTAADTAQEQFYLPAITQNVLQ